MVAGDAGWRTPLARDELPQHDAHREEVRAAVDRVARGLLRRHVSELPLEDTDLRLASTLDDALAMPKSTSFTTPS